jgi:hypothetical protein
LPRQADDFINRGLVFAFALDLFQQGIHACPGPQARKLSMVESFARQAGLRGHFD